MNWLLVLFLFINCASRLVLANKKRQQLHISEKVEDKLSKERLTFKPHSIET